MGFQRPRFTILVVSPTISGTHEPHQSVVGRAECTTQRTPEEKTGAHTDEHEQDTAMTGHNRVFSQVALTLRKPVIVRADRIEATAWLHDRRVLLGTEFASMRDAINTDAVGEYGESYSVVKRAQGELFCWMVGTSIAQGIVLSSRP